MPITSCALFFTPVVVNVCVHLDLACVSQSLPKRSIPVFSFTKGTGWCGAVCLSEEIFMVAVETVPATNTSSYGIISYALLMLSFEHDQECR